MRLQYVHLRLIVPLLLLAALLYLACSPPTRELPSARRGDVLRLATANIFALNPRVASTAGTLAGLDADVLVVLEATGHNLRRPALARAGWALALDAHEGLRLGFGVTVLVRRGLASQAALVPAPVDTPCEPGVAAVRLDVDGRALAVLGIHFAPPAACPDHDDSALAACAAWITDGRLNRDVGPCRSGDPVVVLGDFNTLPYLGGWGPFERSGLRDCWSAANLLPGPTWSMPLGVPALLRIDGVLVPAAWPVLDSWTVEIAGSDHRAVVCDVRRPPD